MKDIKELIFAAVEENAVKFQELASDLLHARAYEAIEALRPEVSASMFGEEKESKKKGNESCDDMDDEDDSGEVDEELKGNQHKIDKNKNGKIDAHDFKLLRKEEVEELDESLSVKPQPELGKKYGLRDYHTVHYKGKVIGDIHKDNEGKGWHLLHHKSDKSYYGADSKKEAAKFVKDLHKEHSRIKEEVELDEQEFKNEKPIAKKVGETNSKADDINRYSKSWRHVATPDEKKRIDAFRRNAKRAADRAHGNIKKTAVSAFINSRKGDGKVRTEETNIQEVAPPKNQADWQALINHQIKVTGHPVATDAQFRATTVGKDTTKIASQEPGEDKMNYAKAQGGEVKQ